MVALYRIAAADGQGRGLAVLPGGDALDVGDDIAPLPAELEKAGEEGVEVGQIPGQDVVVHPPGQQRPSGHEEEFLNGIGEGTGQVVGKGRAGDVIEAVLLPGVSKGGHAPLGGEHPRREQGCVAAAGNVQGAVGILLPDGDQLAQDAV